MRNYRMPVPVEKPCGCGGDNGYTEHDFVPAMAYVPWQYFTTVYEPDKALEVGTIFPELDKPFVGRGIGRR